MQPGTYPKVLRNLHTSAVILTPTMMLFVLALLPLNMQSQENVLSLLAQKVGLTPFSVFGTLMTGVVGGGTLVSDLGGHRRSRCSLRRSSHR